MFNNRNLVKRKRILILIFAVAILIIFFNIFGKSLINSFYIISSPFQKVLWRAGQGTSNFFEVFARIKKTAKKLEKLEEENRKLTEKIASLEELKKENEELRKALALGIQKEFKLSFAEIIGKDVSGDSLLINKGKDDGISEGMAVIDSQKALLGRVAQVYRNFSEVMLTSNKKMSFAIKIQNAKDISGVAQGKGHFKIAVNFILREENISKENIVISDNLGNVFPKGLLVGRIEKIEKKDVEPFQKITIRPDFNIKKISDVFIITGT